MIAHARSAIETEVDPAVSDHGSPPHRAASAALMPLDEAVQQLTANLVPIPPEAVPLGESLGGISAADLEAPRAYPAQPTALRDGWAVRAEAIVGASPYAPIPAPHPLIWVEAGAGMPEGLDTILSPEAIEGDVVVADAPAGVGVRRAGEEIASGARLLSVGDRITALNRLALQAAGFASVALRRPRLSLIVVRAAEADSLSPLLATLAARAGASIDAVIAADTPEAIADTLRQQTGNAILVLGGTGFGRQDHSAAGLSRAGKVQAHGIALKPGETAGFGTVGDRPVLLLPGRPDAALAAFLALARPLIEALSGASPDTPAVLPTLRKIASTIGLSEVVYARSRPDGFLPLGSSDLPLHSLIQADAAILVGPESEGVPAGQSVTGLAL